MKKYGKLVRDRILEIIEEEGGVSKAHIADDEEFWRKLKDKLWEEVDEALQNPTLEEIADILEVIDAICVYKGFNKDEIQNIKEKKGIENWRKLKDKLWEKVDKFTQNQTPGEIADILEVIDAICEYMGFDKDEVQDIKEKKATERGRFEKRIILDES